MRKVMKDTLFHTKTKVSDTETDENIVFPITRWENVLGAPRMLNEGTLENAYPSQYAFFEMGEVELSDEEFAICFPELV